MKDVACCAPQSRCRTKSVRSRARFLTSEIRPFGFRIGQHNGRGQNGSRRSARLAHHSGITLLELMLALGLTGVVLVVISMAIDLNLRMLDTRRADVEQAQLARAVLRHIATDLRSVVWYEPLDLTGLQQMAASTDVSGLVPAGISPDEGSGSQSSGSTGSGTSGGTGGSGRTGSSGEVPSTGTGGSSGTSSPDDSAATGMSDTSGLDELGLEEEVSENTQDIAGTVAPAAVPGLYGNQYELRVDVSRLPRVDQYQGMISSDGQVRDIPSDVKTVSYFLQMEDALQQTTSVPGSSASGTAGLVRRQVDRAVAGWASGSGTLDAADHPGDLLAPEVNYLEFRYFDGTEWYTEWYSEQMGGLPTAIEITIGIDPAFGADPATMDVADVTRAATTELSDYLYRLVVHLPVAQPAMMSDEEALMMMEGLGP